MQGNFDFPTVTNRKATAKLCKQIKQLQDLLKAIDSCNLFALTYRFSGYLRYKQARFMSLAGHDFIPIFLTPKVFVDHGRHCIHTQAINVEVIYPMVCCTLRC